jgi:hypothetical protein
MYWKLGCCSSVEKPDDPTFLWLDQRCRKLSFCLGLRIEDGFHDACFADSSHEKQYHIRPVNRS